MSEKNENLKLAEFGARLVKLFNGAEGIRGGIHIKATVASDCEGDCLDMRASDETVDRYDEVIKAQGWDLSNYVKNPVIQNCHQYGDIAFTLGKALETKVEGGALVQRWQFASDVNPMAKLASGLYRGGFLNTSSVGFIPLEWQNGSKAGEPTRTYVKQELLEVSAVCVPANPNALALAIKSGAIEGADVKEAALLLNKFCNQEERDGHASATADAFHLARLQLLTLSLTSVARKL